MAELATVGSIVGCIGLAGQVAQGCLFIWEFTETIRDSPHLVARLKVRNLFSSWGKVRELILWH